MPQPGQKSITVGGNTLKQLEKKYSAEKGRRPSLSFAAFISEAAILELERRDILRQSHFISVVGFQDNVLTLKDVRKKPKFVEVYLKNDKLSCDFDKSTDCIHIGFALALPEVRKRVRLQQSVSY